MSKRLQLLGISNAIVDVLAHCDDDLLDSIGVAKGGMTLIDRQRAAEVYARMGPTTQMSGGSVANTVAGFANLGGRAGYIGRVADDQFGQVFVHDMQALGVEVKLAPVPPGDGQPTACCYVLITPDGQRSMQTFLGACIELGKTDITQATIGSPQLILLEGYVWDMPEGREMSAKAMQIGRANGARIALSLSDALCVDRHRQSFMQALEDGMALVFANEDEIIRLLGARDFEQALERVAAYDCIFALTRAEKGSVIVHRHEQIIQDIVPVARPLDSTGAGDAYSAGFLYHWLHGEDLKTCAELGSACAASVIGQVGARLEKGVLKS